ncbi:MAG: IPT/TIG domain-containing protein [Myxococcales bacterium]|nr:IPT/TIG domain-containing protein [Myxococcales bacterium]
MPTQAASRSLALVVLLALALGSGGCDALRELRELQDRADVGGTSVPPSGATTVPTGTSEVGVRDAGDAGTDLGNPEVADRELPTFDEPPVVVDLYPNVVSSRGGDLVSIEGARFTLDTEVTVGGLAVAQVDLVDPYEILVLTAPMPAGAYSVKLANAVGVALYEGQLFVVDPLTVDGVEPNEGPTRGGPPLRVRGTGFSSSTRVLVGDREATDVRLVDAETLELTLPPAAARGAVDVRAIGATIATAAEAFTYYDAPELTGVAPSVGDTATATAVRLLASGVDDDCEVWFGGGRAPLARDERGRLIATAPGGPAGVVDVVVDCGERGASRLPGGFELVAADGTPRPVRLDPAAVFVEGGAVVTVSGTSLAHAVSVSVDGVSVPIVATGPSSIELVAPPHVEGDAVVAIDFGSGVVREVSPLRYLSRPRFDSIDPEVVDPVGGVDVVLRGDGLRDVAAIRLDGATVAPAAATDTALRFVAPRGSPGFADVLGLVAGLPLDTGLDLTFARGRRVDRVVPSSGPVTGGTIVTVVGDGFGADCVVAIGGRVAATRAIGSVALEAVTPPHAAGTAGVEVLRCGDRIQAPRGFVYVDPAALPGGVGGGGLDGELNVTVVETGTDARIPGVTVMVGVREDSPFVGLTDALGQITFRGDTLRGPVTVTAFAEQRSAETYADVDARDITLVLAQIPTPPCDPSDPDCVPPPPEPTGTVIGFLTGLDKIDDPPPGAVVGARLETTRYSPGYPNPDPGFGAVRYDDGAFQITTRLGELALVAQCGWFLADGTFVPRRIGVTRGIFLREGDAPWRTTVDCSIRLDERVSFKLTGAPDLITPDLEAGDIYPTFYRIDVSYELGADGHIESLPPIQSTSALFDASGFPALEGPLAGTLLTLTASALGEGGTLPVAQSFVRRIGRYDRVVTFPSFITLPTLVRPSEADPTLEGGYLEWAQDDRSRAPDFYQIGLGSASEAFPRWTVFAPGYARSVNLAEFPAYTDALGWLSVPGEPEAYVSIYLRAIELEVFDYDDFNRVALRSSSWRAASAAYWTVFLPVEP